MATSIFFNGRLITRPGSYSEIDASGLEQVGLGASGIVAILGTAEGGVPASALTPATALRLTRPQQVRDAFRSGDLREACAMIFQPSADPQIPGGAQVVIPIKINPATRSSATFSNSVGTAVQLDSTDYGAFTSQINVSIANGTVQGRLVTVIFESDTEAFDNVGGDNLFTLSYVAPGGDGGWSAMTAQALSSGIRANGTRTATGLDGQILSSAVATQTVRVTATAGDAGQTITIYGLGVGGVAQRETLTLINGIVAGTAVWTAVYGAVLSAVATGTVLVEENTGAFTDLISITAGLQTRGVLRTSAMFSADSALHLVADAASTANIILWGTSGATGATQGAVQQLAGTTPVTTAATWRQIDVIVLGNLAAARTLTISGTAAQTSNSVQNTLQKAADFFNARRVGASGFTWTMVTGQTARSPSVLDLTSGAGQNVLSPAAGSFTADLDALVQTLTTGSQFVVPTRLTFVPQVRDLTITVVNSTTYTVTINGTAVSYTSDGTATAAEIQAGLAAAIAANATLRVLVTAAAQGASSLRITATTPAAFTLSVGANLAIVNVSDVAGVGAMPSNTTSAVFLTGGSEGTTTFSDWQAALDLLTQIRVNSIAVLTGDPAVHAALNAHLGYMCGAGRSERDGAVGLSALDGSNAPLNTLPTLTSIQSQIRSLNSRHLRAFAQSVDRFNTEGELTTFLPWFQGVLALGMQAGAPVGTSLTNKYLDCAGLAQSSTWNPIDDGETLIESGLCFAEEIEGVGRRFVRNVTTHLSTDNLAFVEASVNQAVNYAAFNFRNAMESAVGKRGFIGTINAAKGIAISILSQLMREGVIVQWRALSLVLNGDVLEVSVELAPVIPINFIKNTIHLVTVRQIAA